MTVSPDSITYSYLVSHDLLIIAFVITALNGLEILSADIGNEYLNDTCREKFYFTSRYKFINQKHANAIMVYDMYGLNSTGATWRTYCSENMRDMVLYLQRLILMYGCKIPPSKMVSIAGIMYLFMFMACYASLNAHKSSGRSLKVSMASSKMTQKNHIGHWSSN